MKIDVLDTKGNKKEEITLDESVFGKKENEGLIAHYLHVYRSNQRQGTSSTKTRSEVSGGGKKPWRQKGTGRARAGSIRSPLWRHGGVTHGPKPKSWKLTIPKKMKRQAMQCALSFKYKEDHIRVLEDLSFDKPNTKEMDKIIKALNLQGKTLLVLEKNDEKLIKSTYNIKNLDTALSQNLNAFEVLNNKNLLFLKDSLEKINEKYR